MDLTELNKKSALDVLEIINRYFGTIYPRRSAARHDCYVSQKGDFFNPFLFDGAAYSFGIEYASNETEASKGIFEDGDLFFLEDYDSLDDMIEAMRREIEG
ncbi:MAG: hypothetical protein LUI01_05110 [Firmicutes bacterium]|nr:hypothetical protein [Bacillota bacterium]